MNPDRREILRMLRPLEMFDNRHRSCLVPAPEKQPRQDASEHAQIQKPVSSNHLVIFLTPVPLDF